MLRVIDLLLLSYILRLSSLRQTLLLLLDAAVLLPQSFYLLVPHNVAHGQVPPPLLQLLNLCQSDVYVLT